MPRKQDELISLNDCWTTQPGFLCIHRESSKLSLSVVLRQLLPPWVLLWGFLCWVAVYRKLVWVSLFHLSATQSTALWSLGDRCCRWGHKVDIIWSGASEWPCQPSSAHTNWNCSMSPHLSTAAVIHPPVFSIPVNVALMWFTWLSFKSSSVETLFCYFAFRSLHL